MVGTSVVWNESNPEGVLTPSVIEAIKKQFDALVLEDCEKEVFFYFGNCPGGDIEVALTFAQFLEQTTTPTVAVVDGVVESAAVVICFGCKKRVGLKGCKLGLHSFSYYFQKVIVEELHMELMNTKNRILTLYVGLLDFITRHTRLTREEVDRFFHSREDLHFDLHYALKHGLIDEGEAGIT